MFFKCKAAKERNDGVYRQLFHGPCLLSLINAGIPGKYAEDMANRIIDQAIDEFHGMEMSKYVRWRLDNELENIKRSIRAKEGQTHETKD